MSIALSIAAAVVPIGLLLALFYLNDRFPEPPRVVLTTFGLGFLIVLGLLAVDPLWAWITPTLSHPLTVTLWQAYVQTALQEEFFKFLIVRCYSMRTGAVDESMDGLVYGAAASLGFAAYENVRYVLAADWRVALARSLTAVPAHACFGALMGYFTVRTSQRGASSMNVWRSLGGLMLAIALHGTYNFALLALATLRQPIAGPAQAPPIPGASAMLLWSGYFGVVGVTIALTAWALLSAREHQAAKFRKQTEPAS